MKRATPLRRHAVGGTGFEQWDIGAICATALSMGLMASA
jgi:hypothetical protein